MNAYPELSIYYFSGTGNAKQVSFWFSEVAEKKGIPAELKNIAHIDRKHIQKPPAGALLGFCAPTHGFNYPPVMMYFIFRFPRANNKVFVMNTRAGIRLWKLTIPGLSGVALLLTALVLRIKGYAIVGMRSIDLPSNWISLHPALNKRGIESLFSIFRKVTLRFADGILIGKKNFRALLALPVDVLLIPVSVLYFCFGRFVFAKSFYASRACNNCGLCIKQCPVKAIRLVDNRPYWSYRCESCMHCMNTCPERAIETAHGYVVGLFVLLGTLTQTFIYDQLLSRNIDWFSEESRFNGLARSILESIVAIFALVVSYWLIHYLRRIWVIDLLINYTSLTFYKFWGRYRPQEMRKT